MPAENRPRITVILRTTDYGLRTTDYQRSSCHPHHADFFKQFQVVGNVLDADRPVGGRNIIANSLNAPLAVNQVEYLVEQYFPVRHRAYSHDCPQVAVR